jgi:hypothetical protein
MKWHKVDKVWPASVGETRRFELRKEREPMSVCQLGCFGRRATLGFG